jgi:mycothiol synthase
MSDSNASLVSTAVSPTPLPADDPAHRLQYRRYRGLEDIPAMARVQSALRARVGVLEPVDEAILSHRYEHLENSDPLVDCILAEVDGVVAGYGRTEWHDLTEGGRVHDCTTVVAPDAWGRGIGPTFLAWCEARHRVIARALPTVSPRVFGTEAFGGDEETESAARAAGYEAVRMFAEMLRPDLDDLPSHPLAEGYEIRPVTPDHYPAIWAMNERAFREHWGEWVTGDDAFREWVTDPRTRPELQVVAFHGDDVVAAVANVLEPQPDGSLRGLLDGVATDPAHRRHGLARALIARSLEILRAHGATSAYLGVDTDNHNRALVLYESCGFRVAGLGRNYRKPFDDLEVEP